MALRNDLTQGNVRSHIVRFAIPLIISNLFQALYNAVDMFFVGRFTTTAQLSAVSVSGPIMNVMIMTISGLSIGITILIGNYLGQNQLDDIRHLANTAISLFGLASVVIGALGFLFTPQILSLVQTPAESMDFAVSYLRTIFAGILFMFGYNLIVAFQQGFGDSKSSMLFVIIAGCCNIVLDYMFIAIFSMGAFGAALATVIAQALSFLLGILYFRIKKHIITFSPKELHISRPHLRKIISKGLPAAAQKFLLNISLVTLSGLGNSFGVAASAAYGIGVKIDNFSNLPTDALNSAVSAFTSQNIGADKKDRAYSGLREAVKIGSIIAVATALIVFFFPAQLTSIFNKDPDVVATSVSYLRLSCFSYLTSGFVYPLIGFVRGTGNVLETLKVVTISQYVVRIPAAFLGAHFLGFPGIAVGVIAGPVASMLLYYRYVKRLKRKQFQTSD
ncbi:MATE family efflux transporter [Anaerolentibacter hominis]|uniref:MATE family efflux transporter n=1 Tax=Anaerolentibacter hominis TaxID=3079009 RepID=UPI0031B8A98E